MKNLRAEPQYPLRGFLRYSAVKSAAYDKKIVEKFKRSVIIFRVQLFLLDKILAVP